MTKSNALSKAGKVSRNGRITSAANNKMSHFWRDNKPMIKALESSRMPAKSRLFFKEISVGNQDNGSGTDNHLVTTYDMINIYDNRRNFLEIRAELSDDGSSILREEIVAATNGSLSNAKRTVIDGNKITNKAQIDWIKEMSRNSTCQLFRV